MAIENSEGHWRFRKRYYQVLEMKRLLTYKHICKKAIYLKLKEKSLQEKLKS